MCSVVIVGEFGIDPAQQRLVEKGAQQRVMAGARLMRAGEDCIDDLEFRPSADPSCRDAVSASHDPVTGAGGFKGAHDRGADGDDAAVVGTRRVDRCCGRRRDRYGSSNGSRSSSSGSPVEEMPAAWVRVAKRMPRERIRARLRQSSTKPAEGGSKATGGPAIGVHTSQRASGAGTCVY